MSQARRPEDIVALAGLARSLEEGGIYNGAKLVRAILDRDLRRASDDGRPTRGAGAADGLLALAREAEAGGDGRLADALRAAATAARGDAPLALADAPPVFVCRSCGELVLGEPPVHCPRCEAPSLVFREHVPVWYLEPMTAQAIVAVLAAGPDEVDAIIAGREDDALAVKPRPGEWSARDTLEHIVTAEGLLATRLPRLLTEDDPELVASAAWSETGRDDSTTATAEAASSIADQFRALRQTSVATLRSLDAAGWERPGMHPEWGVVTVRSQAGYFAGHQASHMAQLAAAVEGRVPGRAR